MGTAVLGISALYHDAAAALIVDGVVVAAAQEERFTRVKHDPSMPVRAVNWCLAQAGLQMGDVDHVVFYEKPLRKFERIIATSVATFPRSARAFPRAMRVWLGDKLWTRNLIASSLGVDPKRIRFSEHHLSHAASAFLCSPHAQAAILTIDGVGELATTSLWEGTNQAPFIRPIGEVRFPHSLGLFYSAITAFLGFALNEGEYKVMGMASFGQPRFRAEMDKLLRLDGTGGYDLDLDYFRFHYHPTESYTPKLVALLGEPRFPGSPFVPEGVNAEADPATRAKSQHYADIAASAQAALEDALLHLARHAHATVDSDVLCLAGGVALNSKANQRLAAEGPHKHLWIQPAAGDAGGALGAALWCWHAVLGHPRQPGIMRADLGQSFDRGQTADLLVDLGVEHEDLGSAAAGAERAALDLAEGKVLGWFDGRYEWGPRALGHRSILANPCDRAMKDKVNARIKYREAFRPFAPSIVAEATGRYVDQPASARDPARYMLVTAPVRPEMQAQIPSVTHVDGTARVQAVHADAHPNYHRLITALGSHTGHPVVLNTSFNLKGDAIVSSPVHAVATYMSCELDTLYVDGFRITRKT